MLWKIIDYLGWPGINRQSGLAKPRGLLLALLGINFFVFKADLFVFKAQNLKDLLRKWWGVPSVKTKN